MNKLKLMAIAVAAATSTCAFADGSDDLLSRNHTLSEMKFAADKLELQARMAKSYKDMTDAKFIVDAQGRPLGIGGDMELLARQVRLRGGMDGASSTNSSDPFGGSEPVIPIPAGQSMFGDAGFPSTSPAPAAAPAQAEQKEEKVEVVAKPTEREKDQGKQVLRLAEVRGNKAKLFTNDGFTELSVGQTVYDQKLVHIGSDNVTLKGKNGTRVLQIDWSKSVRYSDN
ncbi:hypothetical protein NPS53_08450 [Pseudomonas putida]|uniref:hypothetical protein n=1 Tax=Pseudomonas putida TaxID=303 RepID=UPI002363561A|nr:hypothetical protein [Pseudomonas putida]MDD2139602.1 hypothetical protein [Pseudomonas putida]HDS1721525.1 hypothetical protein [Pseudomonas putida]